VDTHGGLSPMVVPAHARDCCLLFARAAGGLGGPAFSLSTALKHSKGSRLYFTLLSLRSQPTEAHVIVRTCRMTLDREVRAAERRTLYRSSKRAMGDAGPQDSGVGGGGANVQSRGWAQAPRPRGKRGGDYSTVKYISCVHKS
jgi:hypothetical protein